MLPQDGRKGNRVQKYDIAAYIWPAYTGKEMRARRFRPDGIGEWQTVMNVPSRLCHKPADAVDHANTDQ